MGSLSKKDYQWFDTLLEQCLETEAVSRKQEIVFPLGPIRMTKLSEVSQDDEKPFADQQTIS